MPKRIIGVILGMVAAMAAIMAIQMLSHQVYPIPEGLDLNDRAAVKAHMDGAPVSALMIVLAGYAIGAFLGGLVATVIGKERPMPAFMIGLLLAIGGVANAFMMPQPIWLSAASIIIVIPLALAGARMVKLSS